MGKLHGESPVEPITPIDAAVALPIDGRVCKSTLDLAREIAADLEKTLTSISGTFDLRADAWKIFVLYYGSRLLGVFGAGIVMRSHGFGREAAFIDRAIYEYYTRMLYYSTFNEGATRALQSIPRQYTRLIEKLRLNPRRFLDEKQLTDFENAIDFNADADFRGMRDSLVRDTRFTRQSDKPSVGFYLKESRNRWNIHWVVPSLVVHGSIMDVVAAMKLDADKLTVTGELSSLTPKPNGQLLDSCQFAIYTAIHIEWASSLPDESNRARLKDALVRALAEADALDDAMSTPNRIDGGESRV